MTASLRILSSKADSNTWESFTRSELKLESVHQESPRSDIFRKRATSHFWTRNIIRSILPKELDCCSVVQSPLFRLKYILPFICKSRSGVWRKRGEAQNPCCLKSSVKVSTVGDDLGCHVICWCWSTVFYQVQSQCSHLPGDFGALYASFCWQALWRCWFHFPAGL